MIAEYSLTPDVEIQFENENQVELKIVIEGADVLFVVDEKKILNEIKVSFSGLPLKWAQGRKNVISQSYPEIKNPAFRIYSYIIDTILLKSNQLAYDLKRFEDVPCRIIPETEGERETFSKCRKEVIRAFEMSWSNVDSVNISDFEGKYHLANALSNLSDGIKAENLITKYERYYKLIESFFNDRGQRLDEKVSAFVKQHKSEFTTLEFEELRILRNRCIHPQKSGHISTNDPTLVAEVSEKINKLEDIARLLIENKS
jgi:uncharacterized protein with HEPN domain